MESLPKHHLLKFQPDTLEAIRKLYNLDDPRNLAEAIDVIDTWIKQQNHFLKKDYDRAYIERTLIACKGSIEKTKSQIDKLCTLKTLLPNFFTECNVIEDFKNLHQILYILPLPKLTKDHYRVFMSRASNKPFESSDVFDFYRLNIAIYEYLKTHDYCNGFIVIHDFRNISIKDLLNKFNLVELQQFLRILIEGYGARLKAIHIMNDSKVIDIFVKTLKQFLSAKIGDRIYVHSSNDDIQKAVPTDLLPLEYGGDQKSIYELHHLSLTKPAGRLGATGRSYESDRVIYFQMRRKRAQQCARSQIKKHQWVEELSTEKHREYLKMVYEARTDEMYRQKDKFNEEYMGMPGSFRTLSVD